MPVASAVEGKGVSKLWARRKITDAEAARTLQRLKPDEADALVLALALDHHLVTRLTSLVAVDKTPSRPEGAHLTRAELPVNLPAGWDFDTLFGERKGPDMRKTPDTRRADAGQTMNAASFRAHAQAALPRPVVTATGGANLPQTATDAELRMWFGLALLMASGMLLFVRRRNAWSVE
jgi:Ca-activated chloride channel family protein